MGITPVKAGEIGTIVTALEMTTRPSLKPIPPCPLTLTRWKAPTVENYRILFKRVGGPWLWFSRLVMNDEKLRSIIHHDAVEIHAVRDPQGIEVGILELDFRTGGQCELAYVGLVPELAGQGHGRWLMAHALNMAWRKGIERVWVHTCTLDHPGALGFYRRSGFMPCQQSVEIFADPRVLGALPRDVAPHVPLFEISTV
jgi:GNAT superfamily N-acetyltransferase